MTTRSNSTNIHNKINNNNNTANKCHTKVNKMFLFFNLKKKESNFTDMKICISIHIILLFLSLSYFFYFNSFLSVTVI